MQALMEALQFTQAETFTITPDDAVLPEVQFYNVEPYLKSEGNKMVIKFGKRETKLS